MLVEKIDERLKEKLEEGDRGETNVFRCSSAGSCTRQLAYKKLGYTGEELSARALKVFRIGNIVEADMVDALGELLQDAQGEVVCKLGEIELSGHIDGTYFCPDLKEKFVIDFKSINTRGFTRASKGEVDDRYKAQMNCYMHALGLRRAILIYYNKDTSAMCECVVEYDEVMLAQIKEKFIKVRNATAENLPERDFKPDSKGKLPWQCSYCGFCSVCQVNHELTFTKDRKPILTVKEADNAEV